MRIATKRVASWFGIVAGVSGAGHGYFEILQGNTSPEGLVIASIGPPCVPEEVWNACEPAMTIIPNFLITGILRLPKEERLYQRDETGLSFRRMKKNSLVLFILLEIAVLGEIIFLFLPISPSNTQEYSFLILEAVTGALAYLLVRLQLPVQITEMDEK